MNTSPYDLIIGLDRSDKKADLCLLHVATGERRAVVIDTAPELTDPRRVERWSVKGKRVGGG